MSKPIVYLSGPIRGLNEEQAFQWRNVAESLLGEHFEVLLPNLQAADLTDDLLVMEDLTMVDRARFVLAYVPDDAPCRGTMCELMYARTRLKTVLTWGTAQEDHGGPWVRWVSGGERNCYPGAGGLKAACDALLEVAGNAGTFPRPYAATLESEVHDERIAQDAKWGEQNHADTYWLGIAMEELGEVAKAAIEWDWEDPPEPGSALYEEIVQTEAVLRAWRECMHRRTPMPVDALAGILSDQGETR